MKKAYSSLVFLIILVIAAKITGSFSSSYTSSTIMQEIRHREALQRIEEEKNPKSYIIVNPEIPYVGMPESMINDTKLGPYDYKHEDSGLWGGVIHELNTYSYYQGRHLLLSCETDNGVVDKVNDYRDKDLYSTINRDKN